MRHDALQLRYMVAERAGEVIRRAPVTPAPARLRDASIFACYMLASLLALAAFAFAVAVSAFATREFFPSSTPKACVAACLVCAVMVVASRKLGQARAALIGLTASVSLGGGAWFCLEQDVPPVDWFRDEETIFACLLAWVCGLIVAALAGYVLAHASLRFRYRAVQTLGCAALFLSIATGSLSMLKGAHHKAPAALSARVKSMGRFLTGDESESGTKGRAALEDGSATATLHWDASHSVCSISIRRGGVEDTFPVDVAAPRDEESCRYHGIYRIDGEDIWFVTSGSYFGDGVERAFVGHPSREHGSTYASFASELAPPRAWSIGALAGVILAMLWILPRDRALRARLDWREETLGGKTYLVNPLMKAEPYRDAIPTDDPARVFAGSRAEARHLLMRVRTGRWAFVAATAALFGAPVWVSALCGLAL
jgi:hypothetical protein